MSCLSSLSPLCIFGIFFAQSNAFSLNFVSYKYLGPKQNPVNIRHFIFRFVIFLWFSFFFKVLFAFYFSEDDSYLVLSPDSFISLLYYFQKFPVLYSHFFFLKLILMQSLPYARHCCHCFMCINSLNPLNILGGESSYLSSFSRRGNRSTERFNSRARGHTASTQPGQDSNWATSYFPCRLSPGTSSPIHPHSARHPLSRDPPMAPHSLMQTLCVPYRIP